MNTIYGINESNNSLESIKAKFKDPLWTIGRQWQLGKFIATDGGSLMKSYVKSLHTSTNTDTAYEKILCDQEDISFSLQKLNYTSSEGMKMQVKNHDGGEFNWFDFEDIGQDETTEEQIEVSNLHPFEFPGTLSAKWWDIEDNRTNYLAIQREEVNPLTIAAVHQLIEFGKNDYFSIGISAKPGSIIKVQSIDIVDSFGISQTIVPRNISENKTIFEHNNETDKIHYPNLLKKYALSSPVIEELRFKIDHFSNVLWVIEHINTSSPDADKRYKFNKGVFIDVQINPKKDVTEKIRGFYLNEEGNLQELGSAGGDGIYYPSKVEVFSHELKNIFPFKKILEGRSYIFKTSSKDSAVNTILKRLEELDVDAINEFETALVRKTYLAFNADGSPQIWSGLEHKLSERILPIHIMFDQIKSSV